MLKKFDENRKQGRIKTGAPKVPGKNALIFCTYSGPHTGLREATPVGKYIGQFLSISDSQWWMNGVFSVSIMEMRNAAQKAEWATSEENPQKKSCRR